MSPTGSPPYLSWFLLSYSLFATLRVVFTHFLLNDHDPSGAVTRIHKEPSNKLNTIWSLTLSRTTLENLYNYRPKGETIKRSTSEQFIAFQWESDYTLLWPLRSDTRCEGALEDYRAEFVALSHATLVRRVGVTDALIRTRAGINGR